MFAGPFLVTSLGYSTPFWIATFLSLVNVALIQFFFSETYHLARSTAKIQLNKSFHNIKKALSLTGMRPLFGTSFLYSFGFSFYTSSIAIYLNHRYGFSSPTIGIFYLYMGVWIITSQAVIVRLVAKRFTEPQVLKQSLFWLGLCPALIVASAHWWLLLFLAPFFIAVNSLTNTNLAALVSKSAGPTIQGEVLGINASVQALGQAIPPIIGGAVAAALVYWAPLIVSSVVILIASFVFMATYKMSDSKPAQA
jgi:predicted MFS family arabinose efflux permease